MAVNFDIDRSNGLNLIGSSMAKKISKILESDLDKDKETLEAVKGLSLFFDENNINTRRYLRSNLEKRSLVYNEKFLACFGEAKKVIDSLYSDVNLMNESCQQIKYKLSQIKNQNHTLIKEVNILQNQWKEAQNKQIIANGFIEKFHLEPSEIFILKGLGTDNHQEIVIDENFFEILKKVRKIHEDSKMLLKSNQQITGIEKMDSMSSNEEAAFERLYKWTINCLRSFTSNAYEINPLLYKAMQYIEERPILFKHCLDEYSTIRKEAVLRSFIDALTRRSPSGNSTPIDLHSSDHIRYVNDIMAWIHQTIANEKEILQILLQNCNKEELKQNQTIENSLSLITESLYRPIKTRIEQLLISPPNSKESCGPVILFKVKNLLKFYQKMLSEEISPKSKLILTFTELESLANRVFVNSLNFQCSYKLGKTSSDDYEELCIDLSPNESFAQTINLLKEILSFQNSSLLSSQDKQEVVLTIINVVLKPLLKVCRINASKLSSLDMSIFLLNCLNVVYSILDGCEFSEEFRAVIEDQMNDHLESLITERMMNIISFFGLTAIFNAIKNETSIPLSHVTGCDLFALQSCSKKISNFLSNPNLIELSQLSLLKSDKLREMIKKKSIVLLCQTYSEIYEAVYKKENEFDEPESILSHSPQFFESSLNLG